MCISNKEALIMLSGGRDSFLTACRMIAEGYNIHLIVYDNGCMSGVSNGLQLAERIQKRFGTDRVQIEGIRHIATTVRRFLDNIVNEEMIKINEKYPNLIYNQAVCLACHTSMYLYSIAYCKVNGISVIAEGARKQQGFIIELDEIVKYYRELCHEYDIELQLPVYELISDDERKEELEEWGFLPKSFEIQCWLGTPMKESLNHDQIHSLEDYYCCVMKPRVRKIIDRLMIKNKSEFNSDEQGYF